MELEQLKAAWNRVEQRLDAAEALALQAWREPRQQRLQRELRRFGLVQGLWLLAWLAVVVLAAGFWVHHRHVPHLLVAGVLIHLYGIAAIWVAATRLLLAARLHATGTVLDQLRRLAQLRRFTTISEVALGLPWCWLWLPALQVGMMASVRIDLYAAAPRWFLATLASGLLAMAASVLLARRWAAQPPRQPWLRAMIDHLSGHALARAHSQLQEIARFERE
ncbi:hypothetical protein [Stenotrophomonas sp. YIM B06876]|uniref:hypothetical protein n=1 Tax=Stenotrophomonas sp. YIM B06876 TaxID=3060211 RepID=UPI00273977DC|nr:hypothetical protein [Stenotrophomonas sp. YIM B06876]